MRITNVFFLLVLFLSLVMLESGCNKKSATDTKEDVLKNNTDTVASNKKIKSEIASEPVNPKTTKSSAATKALDAKNVVQTAAPSSADTSSDTSNQWGTIKGRIVVDGVVPAPKKIAPSDGDFCGKDEDMFERSLIVSKDGGLKNAILFLKLSKTSPQSPKIHPSYEKAMQQKALIDNVNCVFSPHVVGLTTSQILTAKNSDPKGHNVLITSRNNGQNKNLPPNSETDLILSKPERLPVKVTCSIHPWMQGYVVVRDDPYFAITDANGNFEIKNMPEGEWKFQFWHEKCGYMKDLVDKDGVAVMSGRPVSMDLKVSNRKTNDLGTLTISAESLK